MQQLHVTQAAAEHEQSATAVSFNQAAELVTASDDRTFFILDQEQTLEHHLTPTAPPVAAIAWHPNAHPKKKESDVFVIGCTDGTFKFANRQAKIDAPKMEANAHQGAITKITWARDGTRFATAGEDGMVKSWARNGMFRSNLAQSDNPIYALCWSPDSDQILFTSDCHLVVRPLQPSSKQTMWKAHDAPVLTADWNPLNGLIVSGGEDCRYRIWDSFGRQLYCSAPCEYSVTSISWAPNGRYFAVGSFNMLRLCDKAGWSYSRAAPSVGSLFDIAWTNDSTQVAAGCASGAILFGQLVNREIRAGGWEARQTGVDSVTVVNAIDGHVEELHFKERVTEMSLSQSHLIVITATQCCIHSTANFNTPHVVEIRGTVSLIMQNTSHFLMVDSQRGMQVIGYDGRALSQPKFPGMRVELLSPLNVAYAPDLVAIIDSMDTKIVRLIEPLSARQLGTISHSLEVEQVALSQTKGVRRLVLVDKNRDMYITPTQGLQDLTKMSTMVDAVRWSEDTSALATISDGHLVIWYYPEAVFIDRDVLPQTLMKQPTPEIGKTADLVEFRGSRATIRRADGATVVYAASPFPCMLERFCSNKDWESALRLCRYVKSAQLWACLAVIAIAGRELHTAEVAYAAIDIIDKVVFMAHIKELPTAEAREAELLLFQRRRSDAINVLVQAGWYYRAIKMLIRCFAWEQAYDLARTHKCHLDTVLYHRQKYLASVNRTETIPKLQQLAQELGTVDEIAIKARVEQEKVREKERASTKKAVSGVRGGGRGR